MLPFNRARSSASPAVSVWRPVLGLLLCLLGIAILLLVGNQIVQTQRIRYRGVEYDRPQLANGLPASPWGVNVALEQYSEAELTQAFRLLKSAGFHWLRQRIPWNETQPTPEQFQWDRWDWLIAQATKAGFEIIAVLDGAPLWARAAVDKDNTFAPPCGGQELC